ncbi:MAG: hypothetical protein AAGF11_48575 [Myxococcota bacterium]
MTGRQQDLGPGFRQLRDEELDDLVDEQLDVIEEMADLKTRKEQLGERILARMQALRINVYEARDGTPIVRESTEKVTGKRKKKRKKKNTEDTETILDKLEKSGAKVVSVTRDKGKPN